MDLLGKRICMVRRGSLDNRSIKSARALSDAGAKVTILLACHICSNEYEREPFDIKYCNPVEAQPSYLSNRYLRIVSNLLFVRLKSFVRMQKYGVFGENLIFAELLKIKPDAVHAINADVLEPCFRYAHSSQSYLVYEAYEFWPDHKDSNIISMSKAQRKTIGNWESRYLPKVDLGITVSDTLSKYYQSDFNLRNRFKVIFNSPIHVVESACEAQEPIQFLYVGYFNLGRNLLGLLKTLSEVKGVRMTFLGDGPLRKRMLEDVHRMNLGDRVIFKEMVSQDCLISYIRRYDVGVIPFKNANRHFEGALPNKFFEYISAGLAVLATKNEALSDFQGIDAAALLVDDANDTLMSDAFGILMDNPKKVTAMKAAALTLARKNSGESQAAKLYHYYQQMFSAESPTRLSRSN